MIINLFDQFAPATLLNISLIPLAMLLPWLLFPTPTLQWKHNRLQTFQNWFLTTFTKQLLLPLNTSAHKWAFLFTSLLIFLLTINLLGLLPYTFTPTTQLSINLGLAIPLWLATVLVGFRNQFTHSLAHFLPEGTPTPLIPALIVIETISLFIRPLALGVRLTANLTAGHLLIHLVSSAVPAIFFLSPATSLVTFIVLTLLIILELMVAIIQAYVFVLLLSLYLQENTYGPPNPRLPYSRPKPLTPNRSHCRFLNSIRPRRMIPLWYHYYPNTWINPYINNHISMMTRCGTRRNLPGPPHCTSTKRPSLWHNSIYYLWSIFLSRLFLGIL